ncbi:non-ribosomal peptide synthetase [Micromonospora sp. WMMA1998]|uniref:non-ribosomal peptide synthetase n=1 Tax=unclassified Micromonospora TaxID=2617518 RepID=UPI00248C72CD|nr:non-ribosomal peptide synthetase [Micromonospora sp. WMMA1998]WBC16754.1 non-ribosomal peptide synthetase [Micromonospora sp. WMMA1998]
MTKPRAILHSAVVAQSDRTPDAIAVIDGNTALTYRDLVSGADRIAGALVAGGTRTDDVVAIVPDRSAAMVTALLGILRAGAAYLPIEPGTPPARTRQLVADARARICLAGPGEIASTAEALRSVAVVLPFSVAGPTPGPALPDVHPDGLCAVYYTSGSTGHPKGVACTHRGWTNRMDWMQRHHPLSPAETVLHKTTLTFDDAAVELFWPLAAGGRTAMLAPGAHRDPRAIIDAAIRYEAVHLNFVPSMLELVLDELTDADVHRLHRLRSVLSSGEALPARLAERFLARFGDTVTLDNTWGATEVSIDSTCHTCTPEDRSGPVASVSIGGPIDRNEVLVLDDRMQAVPDDEAGDLYIGGIGLARGYLHAPGRTAAAFLPHPWRPGERVYRTGDRGRRDRAGRLHYLDRQDRQVKIRGVRIELGEIEAVMRGYDGVSDAAATTWRGPSGDARIALFLVVDQPGLTAARLREHAAATLPGYAVPSAIELLDHLPRLPSGKLDRQALPTPAAVEQDEHVAPRTPPEKVVARIWEDMLGAPRVGATDNFFALGGHSLLAIRTTSQMIRTFGTDIPMNLLFEHPTVEAVAARIEELVERQVAALSDEDVLRMARS